MQLPANSVQLISGGNVIKHGDETPFTFQLNDESGQPVDLTGATVNIRLANSQIVVLEKQATINDDNTVTFNISSEETTGHGNMRLEFVVSYPDETIEIFPAQGYQEITITPSLGGLDSGYVAVITIEEFERRINEAVDKANNAADNATQAIENVDDVIQSANTATQFANEAGQYAGEQGDYAKDQGDYAKQQGDIARDESSNLSQLKEDVVTATDSANQSATNADNAATNANEQATFANTQGNYAKEQGDYAKQQGDAIQDIFDEGLVASVNGKTGAVVLDASDVGAETPEGAQAKADTAEQNAKTYVDNLEIGGRNLLREGMFLNLIPSSSGQFTTYSTGKGFYIPVTSGEVYSLSRSAATNDRFRYCFSVEEPASGVEWSNMNTHDSELKVENIVVPEGVNYLFVYILYQTGDIPKIKLEKGNKATDWTPAPEDVQAEISAVEQYASSIDQKANQIEDNLTAHQADYTSFKAQTQSDIGNKNSLLTTDKSSLVAAINEVFTNGNNVKADTVGALLSVDDSLPITENDSWQNIINAIGGISTGKKWASGILNGGSRDLNIGFRPSVVLIKSSNSDLPTAGFIMLQFYFEDPISKEGFGGAINRRKDGTSQTANLFSVTIKDDGFSYSGGYNDYGFWIAYE